MLKENFISHFDQSLRAIVEDIDFDSALKQRRNPSSVDDSCICAGDDDPASPVGHLVVHMGIEGEDLLILEGVGVVPVEFVTGNSVHEI